ncbi:MAG: glycoside hydrolase family 3 protein, partial [Cruoricaptor ignavus]|nr:glycoside hydrolase family 3 protein [Cruoricaptor ignavus]
EKLYANALTVLKNEKNTFPIDEQTMYYYIPLEEAPYQTFANELKKNTNIIIKQANEIHTIPKNGKVIIGFHKDNSTAYKPYKISEKSKNILSNLAKDKEVSLIVFGSPYALKDVDICKVSSVLVAYENNDDAMRATAKALKGETKIHGKLPVLVNKKLKAGTGIEIEKK